MKTLFELLAAVGLLIIGICTLADLEYNLVGSFLILPNLCLTLAEFISPRQNNKRELLLEKKEETI